MGHNHHSKIRSFIDRWAGREGGQERANYSLFLTELCDVLEVARPDPASASHEQNDYVFERRVERSTVDGTRKSGRIDLYKRGHFILEAKQSLQKKPDPTSLAQGDLFSPTQQQPAWQGSIDHLMIQARRQAEHYARCLPRDHSYPPFLIVCDVGRTIELYADFSGHGRHYSQFPDANRFRLALEDLANDEHRSLLRQVWEAPLSLDPSQQTAKVTREIAGQLAELSKALEDRGFEPRAVAIFLMRCLFTMFVEDIGLLPKKSFTELLTLCLDNPKRFNPEIDDLWRNMDKGGYSPGIGERLLQFNGKLFKNASALPLNAGEIRMLRDASSADWCELEPAIFGSLFEQALEPAERRKLGAHYTPRAYVERVVDTTIIEPLTEDWIEHQSSAERALRAGMKTAAIREIEDFLRKLATTRVLDPACGTGNFLYVALRRMKQLEGEVLKQLQDIGGDDALAAMAHTSVKPEQFFGLEWNTRAVEIAELVLWVGYIQWHMRIRTVPPPAPVLSSKDHVQQKDALLTWMGYPEPQLKRDALGKPVADMQGHEMWIYPNPIAAEWPEADFIIGNPPFVGGKDIRSRHGPGYADALGKAYPAMNPSADIVMYWWHRAAGYLTRKGSRLRRFGFVTTNSITQVFQRRVVEQHLTAAEPMSLVLAIPDHPWTKASRDAAAVRIAITVAERGAKDGALRLVTSEEGLDSDEPKIGFVEKTGRINSDLTIGADISSAGALVANEAICYRGVQLMGSGFIVTREKALELGLGRRAGLDRYIKHYRNGRDLTARPRNVMVIDLFGLTAEVVRRDYPEVYQHLLETVKPERDRNNRQTYRERWWQFGEPRREMRPALEELDRYIATVETAKHRVFQFLETSILPDNMLVAIASDDAAHLGILSSSAHASWALRSGGKQGVGNDPRYSKSRCFDPFPFPDATASAKRVISELAEELDSTRKLVLTENPDLTLTGLYNVLEQLRASASLSAKDKDTCNRGRVLILKELHEGIDQAVAQAYGWNEMPAEDEIIERLVALNQKRASEERQGLIRWLRPEYQTEKLGQLAHRADRVQTLATAQTSRKKPLFPTDKREQAGEIRMVLAGSGAPLSFEQIAARYRNKEQIEDDIRDVLTSLGSLGVIESFDEGRSYVSIAS